MSNLLFFSLVFSCCNCKKLTNLFVIYFFRFSFSNFKEFLFFAIFLIFWLFYINNFFFCFNFTHKISSIKIFSLCNKFLCCFFFLVLSSFSFRFSFSHFDLSLYRLFDFYFDFSFNFYIPFLFIEISVARLKGFLDQVDNLKFFDFFRRGGF